MLNTININLKTDIKTDRPTSLPITLMSQDKNNNQFILRFTSGGEPVALDDTYTVEVLTKFSKSGVSRLTSAIVRQGYSTWEFDTAYITQDEEVRNYVYVRKSGNLVVSADANCFVFNVDLSEIDKGAGKVAETYDENYEKYLDEFKDNVNFEEIAQAEQARREAELLREENYEQKLDTAIVEADVVEKVDNKVTELTPQINNLTAQLAQITQRYVIADFIGVTSYDTKAEAELNVADGNALILQPYLDQNLDIKFLKNKFYPFESSLRMKNSSIIGGDKKGEFASLCFPNSKGFVYATPGYYNEVTYYGLKIYSLDHCIDFKNDNITYPNNVFRSRFENMVLNSVDGNCVHAGDNIGVQNDNSLCFDDSFRDIMVTAPNGAGFYGIRGLGNIFEDIRDAVSIKYVFQNCLATFRDINTSFAGAIHFLYIDNTMPADYSNYLEFDHVNMEDIRSNAIKIDNNKVVLTRVVINKLSIVIDTNFTAPPAVLYPIDVYSAKEWHIIGLSFTTSGAYTPEQFYDPTVKSRIKHTDTNSRPKIFGMENVYIRFGAYDVLLNATNVGYAQSILDENWGKYAYTVQPEIHADHFVGGRRLTKVTTPAVSPLDLRTFGKSFDIIELTATSDETIQYLIRDNKLLEGTVITLKNISDFNITIYNRSGYAGQLHMTYGGSVVLTKNQSVQVMYDLASNSWRQIDNELKAGITAHRPVTPRKGQSYYDITIDKPVWYNGANWVDVNGVIA